MTSPAILGSTALFNSVRSATDFNRKIIQNSAISSVEFKSCLDYLEMADHEVFRTDKKAILFRPKH